MPDEKIVTDSGPIIHLTEVDADFAWNVFPKVLAPDIVKKELAVGRLPGSDVLKAKRFKVIRTTRKTNALAKNLFLQYKMGLNDSIILSHAIERKATLLLTDDLQIRVLCKSNNITPVGSIGILYLSFREGYCDIAQLFNCLDQLFSKSSLYITKDIIKKVKREAKREKIID